MIKGNYKVEHTGVGLKFTCLVCAISNFVVFFKFTIVFSRF